MTAADVVAEVRDERLEDFIREAVVLIARELMEAEISGGRRRARRTSRRMSVSSIAMCIARGRGDAGRGDRAADSEQAPGQLLPVVS